MFVLTPNIPELNGTLIGTYYIGVLGKSSSVYTLNYHIELRDEKEEGNSTYKIPILLNQNNIAKGVLVDNKDYQIYKI